MSKYSLYPGVGEHLIEAFPQAKCWADIADHLLGCQPYDEPLRLSGLVNTARSKGMNAVVAHNLVVFLGHEGYWWHWHKVEDDYVIKERYKAVVG